MSSATHFGGLATSWTGAVRKLWNWWRVRYRFKYVLPGINETEIDGIKIDLTPFSPKVRNRILLGYEQPERQMCRQLLRKSDAVLELGGGIGFIGLFCQKRLGITNYLTIEANPRTIEILRRNYQLNGCNPHVLNFALSNQSGTAALDIKGDFWEHRLTQTTGPTTIVPSIDFPSLLETAPFRPNTLIIDVEGAERFINFREIPEEIKKIIVEIHPVIVGEAIAQGIIQALRDNSFDLACNEGDTFAFIRCI